MASFAFWLWAATVAIGGMMVARFLDRKTLMASRALPSIHGLFGAVGFMALVIALGQGDSATPDRYGTASFAPIAAAVAALAIVIGLLVTLRGRRPGSNPGFLIGVHATIAVTAFVLLMAYVWLV